MPPCSGCPNTPNSWCSRSEEHTSELQSLRHLVCRLLLEKKNVSDVISNRTPWSEDWNSAIYRSYVERWLETLILRCSYAFDTNMDTEYVLYQVHIYRGD